MFSKKEFYLLLLVGFISFSLFSFAWGFYFGQSFEKDRLSSESSVYSSFRMYGLGFRSESEVKVCENITPIDLKMWCLGFKEVSNGG